MTADSFSVEGNVVDIPARRTFPARVAVEGGRIAAITPIASTPSTYLLPGFIDAHVHIESSMLVPSEFARAAVVFGTVATVSDPHEIGNVLGVAGVRYMLENAARVPFKFNFGAPSCVPATSFETAGAEISVAEVVELLDEPRIRYLSEMMNFPGILHRDPACLAKVKAAHDRGKPIDGHAPDCAAKKRPVISGPASPPTMNASPRTKRSTSWRPDARSSFARARRHGISMRCTRCSVSIRA